MQGRDPDHAVLKRLLDAQYEAFNVEDSATDPVQFVHRANPDPADREIVARLRADSDPGSIVVATSDRGPSNVA